MEREQLIDIVEYCLKQWRNHELPWCEFKTNFHSADEIWENISAIWNVARILDRPDWYVVFWVEPKSHTIVGTNYNYKTKKWKWNEDLLPWLIRKLDWFSNFTFHELDSYQDHLRIVVLVINSADIKPIVFDGKTFIRVDTYTKPINLYKDLESKLWEKILWSSFDRDICLSKISSKKVIEYIDLSEYSKAMWYEANGRRMNWKT